MMARPKTRWIFLLSLILVLMAFSLAKNLDAQKGKWVGTQTCINCHQTWLDNDPSVEDTLSGLVSIDYLPANLSSTRTGNPFYTIPEGYVSSLHYTPSADTTAVDYVTCEACHGSGAAHYGVGSIPIPIPGSKTCGSCHPERFEEYVLTSHANKDRKPGKYFDQLSYGLVQAKTRLAPVSGSELVPLYKAGPFGSSGGSVSRNERIEECSVCHNYALQYPTYRKKIAQGNFPPPQVSCGACHNAHIVGPSGDQPAQANTTVKVTGLAGSTVTSVAPVEGRSIFYVNNKPYKISDAGAQDTIDGVWTRGSAFNRPSPVVVQGIGVVGNSSDGVADRLTLSTGLSAERARPGDTLFISGEASARVNLPADAINAGAPVTVKAILDHTGFLVQEAIDRENLVIGVFDQTLILESREDPAREEMLEQLGTDKIGIVAKASVTYRKGGGGTGTLNVFVPFIGEVNFEVRDMRTNTETLCQSCHTQGKHKYTGLGRKRDGTFVDLSPTHNKNIGGQYRRSGHANGEALPFKEFSAFEYGSTHQPTYPFDMSIPGTGGVNSLRNKSNTTFQLTQTPNPANAYLGTANNTNQVVLINNYPCNQCHHGLGAIDYMKDRQGTSSAQVLWGDATVTCITCHETHKDPNGSGKNVRVPTKLSYNARFVDPVKNPRGGINKFMDGTDIPSDVGSSLVCLFCHQGRESGWTVYSAIKAKNVDPYSEPNKVIDPVAGISFLNPHYLDGGGILWSRNSWEYFFSGVPQKYTTGNSSHQQKNCNGCHMGEASPDNSEGGHTWRPRIEVCQECHGPIKSFKDVKASVDYDGDGTTKTTYEEFGTINPDTGLFGRVKAALEAKGIFYSPDTYPYFFTPSGGQFRAWTTNTLSAAFNLAYSYKAENAVYTHNAKYIVQVLQDSLKALDVTPTGVRPAGDRNATDYSKIVLNP